MAGGGSGGGEEEEETPTWGIVGKVTCAAWIQRRGGGANRLLVVYGRAGTASSLPLLELLPFDARACVLAPEPLLRVAMGEGEDDAPRAIAVRPGSDDFVCATAKGCRMDISEYFIGQVSGCFWMNLKLINLSKTWTSGDAEVLCRVRRSGSRCVRGVERLPEASEQLLGQQLPRL